MQLLMLVNLCLGHETFFVLITSLSNHLQSCDHWRSVLRVCVCRRCMKTHLSLSLWLGASAGHTPTNHSAALPSNQQTGVKQDEPPADVTHTHPPAVIHTHTHTHTFTDLVTGGWRAERDAQMQDQTPHELFMKI